MTAALALAAVLVVMVVELRISQRNERRLRAGGATEPAGDVYPWLRIIYPACFVAMAAEGVERGASLSWLAAAGLLVLVASKTLKAWAIASLGENWSFHVLVRPPFHLVHSGPYRYLRHPNAVAIIGEVLGMAMLVRAPVTGVMTLILMGILLSRRIVVEERALGLRA